MISGSIARAGVRARRRRFPQRSDSIPRRSRSGARGSSPARSPGGQRLWTSPGTGAGPPRAASLWRALERMPAYQVPIVLGGALAALVGAVALGVAVVAERVLGISWVRALLLIAFGALALIGYKVTRANLRNGAVVAGIAGVALIVVAGGTAGLVAGLLVLAGALWGLLKSF